MCVFGVHMGPLVLAQIYIYFFSLSLSQQSISISHLLSQLDTRRPIASNWQNYCSTVSFVYAFEVVYLTIIVYMVA